MDVRQTELMKRLPEETEGKYLTFWVAKQLFAVSIANVEQIIGIQEVTEVPDAPAYAKGIINLRGAIIPVIDMRLRLNKPEATYNDRTCIIVARINQEQIGFIVDEVDEVTDIGTELVSPPPKIGDAENRYLTGVARLGGENGGAEKIALLLDISKIMSEGELSALSKTIG